MSLSRSMMSWSTPSSRYRKRTPDSSGSIWMSDAPSANAPANIDSSVSDTLRTVLSVRICMICSATASGVFSFHACWETFWESISRTPCTTAWVFFWSWYRAHPCSRLAIDVMNTVTVNPFVCKVSIAFSVSGLWGLRTATETRFRIVSKGTISPSFASCSVSKKRAVGLIVIPRKSIYSKPLCIASALMRCSSSFRRISSRRSPENVSSNWGI